MIDKVKIQNKVGEELDTWIEWESEKPICTVVMVHGFGTDKHETAGYFDDIAKELINNKYRVIRFDFSGCGKSEGKTEDIDYVKHTQDLRAILGYVQDEYPERIYILAQSMGCFVTALLNPDGINKAIFTGLPNANTDFIKERLIGRFGSKEGAVVNKEGISLFPRSSGKLQKIGSNFWKVLANFDPVKAIEKFNIKTKLLVVHPNQDEIVGSDYLDPYGKIKEIKRIFIDGDHSFKNNANRKNLIRLILSHFEN